MVSTKLKSPPKARNASGKEDSRIADEARRILRAEMVRRAFSFKKLSDVLAAQPRGETEESVQALINKVNRGRFSFAFFYVQRVRWALPLSKFPPQKMS